MIEALESRQLLSVPNIAGHWVGKIAQSIDGADPQMGTISVNFVQRGKAVACAETDTLGSGNTVGYCRGTIDAKGKLLLKWSENRSMRPIIATDSFGKLFHGKISIAVNFVLNGHAVGTAFRIHRG